MIISRWVVRVPEELLDPRMASASSRKMMQGERRVARLNIAYYTFLLVRRDGRVILTTHFDVFLAFSDIHVEYI